MASTVFVNGVTLSDEDFFNDINRLHYTIFSDPADVAAVKATLHASPGAIGSGTPSTGAFTTLSASSTLTATGLVGFGVGGGSSSSAILVNTVVTGMAGTTQQGFEMDLTGTSAATGTILGFRSRVTTSAAAFTCTNLIHFYADDITKGAGSTITNQYGFYAVDQTQGGTSNTAFYGAVSAGSGKYNINMAGSAQNYLAGVTGIGITPSTTAALNLPTGALGVAPLRIGHGSAPTSPVDGDIWTTSAGLYVRVNGSTVGPLS